MFLKTKKPVSPMLFWEGCILVVLSFLLSEGSMNVEGKILIVHAIIFIVLGGILSLYLDDNDVPGKVIPYSLAALSWGSFAVIVVLTVPSIDVFFGADIILTDGVWIIEAMSWYVFPFFSLTLVCALMTVITIGETVSWYASHRFFGIGCPSDRQRKV